MHDYPSLKRFAAAVLLLVLVATEAMAVAHSLDFDAHAAGDPCKICVSAASLGHGASAAAVSAEPPRAYPPVATTCDSAVPAPRPARASARGPPLVS